MSSKTKNFIEKNLNIIFFIFVIFFIILYLFEVIIPFLIAFIITYLTNPLKIYLDKYVNETFSSFLSIIAFILCFLFILVLIFPILIYQIQNLVLLLPEYLEKIEIFLRQINSKYLFLISALFQKGICCHVCHKLAISFSCNENKNFSLSVKSRLPNFFHLFFLF